MVGSFFRAVQDFRIGVPGMGLQVAGGYLLLKYSFNKHAFRANLISAIPQRGVFHPINAVEEWCPLIVRDANLQTVEVCTSFPTTANLLHKGR